MTTDELFAKQKTLVGLRQRTEDNLSTLGKELTLNRDDFFSMPLETITTLPETEELSARLLTKLNLLASHLGGKDMLRTWIHSSLQGSEWKKTWLEKGFQERTVYNANDPAWLKEIELEWQRTKSENHLIVGFEPEKVEWVGKLILFLRLYMGAIQDELFSIERDLGKVQIEEKQTKEPQLPSSAIQSPTTDQEGLAGKTSILQQKEEKNEQTRVDKKALMKKAREIYLSHQSSFVQKVNAFLPSALHLETQDAFSVFELIEISTILRIDSDSEIEGVFRRYGLWSHFEGNNEAFRVACNEFREMRNARRQEMEANNQSTKILTSSDNEVNQKVEIGLVTLAKASGASVVTTALTTKPSALQEAISAEPTNKLIGLSQRITTEFKTSLVERPKSKNLFDLIGNTFGGAFGQTNEEDFSSDESIADLVGEDQNQEIGGVAPNPLVAKKRIEQLKRVSQTALKIASNPYGAALVVGAGGAGVFVGGLLAQAPGIMAAGGALVGSAAGGAIGFFVGGPVGFFIGAGIGGAIGGGGAYLFGLSKFGGSGGTQALTNIAAGASKAGATAASGAATGATSLASQAATGAGNLFNALPHLSSALSTLPGSATLVFAPLAAAGIVTTVIIMPTIMSAFLPPKNGTSEGAESTCDVGSWPVGGTISATKNYKEGESHAIWKGIVPQKGVDLPLDGKFLKSGLGKVFAAVDIGENAGALVYSPYAGTAFAQLDEGTTKDTAATCGNGASFVAGVCWNTPYGNSIWVKVNDPAKGNFVLIFAHLESFGSSIPVGQPFHINANAFLGKVGASGNAEAAHLHYEVIGLDKVMDLILKRDSERAGGKGGGRAPEVSEVKSENAGNGFNAKAFEDELVEKYKLKSLQDARNLADKFSDDEVTLKNDFVPEEMLNEASPDIKKIDESIDLVDDRIFGVSMLLLNLRKPDFVAIVGFGFPATVREDRRNYIEYSLDRRLDSLLSRLGEKKERFQEKKDKILAAEFSDPKRTELDSLHLLCESVGTETAKYTSLGQFVDLGKRIQDGVVSVDHVIQELKSKGMSDAAINKWTLEVRAAYAAEAHNAAEMLGNLSFDWWKKNHLTDKALSVEYVNLTSDIEKVSKSRITLQENIDLRNHLGASRRAMSSAIDVYISQLPGGSIDEDNYFSGLKIRAKVYLESLIQEAEENEKTLLDSAKLQVDSELRKSAPLKNLMDALAQKDDATIDLKDRIDHISNARISLEKNKKSVISGFDTSLENQVQMDLEKIEEEAKAVEEDLIKKRTDVDATVLAERKQKLSDIITKILELDKDPLKAWAMDLGDLEKMEDELKEEILQASKIGVDLSVTQYTQAKTNIEKYLKEKKEISEDEIARLWGEIRGNFAPTGVDKNEARANKIKQVAKEIDRRNKEAGKSSEIADKWSMLFDIWNGFAAGAAKNGVGQDIIKQLMWAKGKSDTCRDEVKDYTTFAVRRKFLKLKEEFGPSKTKVSDVQAFKKMVFNAGEFVCVGPEYGKFQGKKWNYSQKGNPSDEDQASQGLPTLSEIVQLKFPDVPSYIIDSVCVDLVVINEERLPLVQPYYETWEQSPVGEVDFKPISVSAPMAYILYNVLSNEIVPVGHRRSFQILRLPSAGGIGREEVSLHNGKSPREFIRKPAAASPPAKQELAIPNVHDAIRARDRHDRFLTQVDADHPTIEKDIGWGKEPVQLSSVELGEDYVVFPYMDHIAEGLYPGDMTLPEYIQCYKAFDEFREYMEAIPDPKSITSEQTFADALTKSVDLVSSFKGMFDVMKTKTAEDPQWRVLTGFVRQEYLRYIKDLWDVYNRSAFTSLANRIETLQVKGKKERFISICKSAIGGGKLPDQIKVFVNDVLDDATKGNVLTALVPALGKNANTTLFTDTIRGDGIVDIVGLHEKDITLENKYLKRKSMPASEKH